MNHLHQEIARLRDQVSELEEALRQEREVAKKTLSFPREWGLTRTHEAILSSIAGARDGYASRDRLMRALPQKEPLEYDSNILYVHIARMRVLLSRFDIEIENVWARGYRLPPDSLAKVRTAQCS